MAQHVLLNNVEHHDLRVITRRDAALGDAVMLAHTFPAEFRALQAHYPIVYQKTADGLSFQAVALLGLQPGQNLFLDAQGWDAAYIPLALQRLPFLIGRDGQGLQVHVDLDSPRLSRSQGEPLFLPHGGTAPYLQRISDILGAIHHGVQQADEFLRALLSHDLLEPFVLETQDAQGQAHKLGGFYTVHEDRLAALQAADLAELHAQGHLQCLYMMLASQSQFASLMERQARALAAHV
ncbi:SapC family protein [Ideonella paludis]|uniref:SapC family protein n=1 Tax=Ideonella paludis TaxID=1233411 RepID=A0ABS5DY62_9BURK|nr:SapC family protein [Ideonella paludis]MBQ0935999.1 SapC family protein [Ideonella paludis]